MRRRKVYRPKSLIDGADIGERPGTSWVAVPDKFADVNGLKVVYGQATMTIKDWRREARLFRRFRDRFWKAGGRRPQYYTLGYFPFNPDSGVE